MRYLIAAVVVLGIVLVATFQWRRTGERTAREQGARLADLHHKQVKYQNYHDYPAAYDGKDAPRPLSASEDAEMEELKRRVGKWEADHPTTRP